MPLMPQHVAGGTDQKFLDCTQRQVKVLTLSVTIHGDLEQPCIHGSKPHFIRLLLRDTLQHCLISHEFFLGSCFSEPSGSHASLLCVSFSIATCIPLRKDFRALTFPLAA